MPKLISFAGLFVFLFFITACKKEDVTPTPEIQIIKVAALISETGDWSNLGITSKAALQIAQEEINCSWKERELPLEFQMTYFDTELNPALAAEQMSMLAAQGYKLVIGPQSSAEVAAVKSIADSLGILVVSQGSTASSLAIANDMIFRLVPGDQIEGAAMVNTMMAQGKQAVITLAREDAGNMGLQLSVENNFQNAGGQVVSLGTYPTATTDFTEDIVGLSQAISTLSATYPTNQIGVYLASFDEATLLFQQAANYPVLASVNWYGGDGFVRNASLPATPAAAQFAQTTGFFCPEFGLPESSQATWSPLVTKVSDRCGIEPDAFTLAAYDALKLFARVVEQDNTILNRKNDLTSSFTTFSNSYTGATGTISLNASGDRANGSFDYWGITSDSGSYQWTFVGQSE